MKMKIQRMLLLREKTLVSQTYQRRPRFLHKERGM
jgi:hypothetical protein